MAACSRARSGYRAQCTARATVSTISQAAAAELAAGTLRPVPVTGVDLTRALRAVWPDGRRLTGPALDLYTIAARAGHRSRPARGAGLTTPM